MAASRRLTADVTRSADSGLASVYGHTGHATPKTISIDPRSTCLPADEVCGTPDVGVDPSTPDVIHSADSGFASVVWPSTTSITSRVERTPSREQDRKIRATDDSIPTQIGDRRVASPDREQERKVAGADRAVEIEIPKRVLAGIEAAV